MNKGIAVIFIALITISSLQAASHYGFVSNGFEPSAMNLALGGSPVGVVNVWHNDPLNAYGNPALPSLHSGVSYSSTKYDYQKVHYTYGEYDEYLAFSSALATLSYKGIGLLFPMGHPSSNKSGSYTDYGSFQIVTEENFDGYSVNLHDQAKPFGLSINLPEVIELMHPQSSLISAKLDLAMGLNIIENTSRIHLTQDPVDTDARSVNLGLLARLKHSSESTFRVESAFGMSYFNAFKHEVSLNDGQSADVIYQRLNLGLGLSGARINPKYDDGLGILNSFENVYSIRAFGGVMEEFADDPLILGAGAELGLLDAIFFRTGYHYDKAGKIDGLTCGLGINLHYRNLFSVFCDLSRFPGGATGMDKKTISYGISIDPIAIFNEGVFGNK